MMHGLMWLPLLAIFIGLAWAGWNEYQKLEQYRVWAKDAERAKYDIRAALIQKDGALIWGTPSRSGILNPQTLSLDAVTAVSVQVDRQTIDLDQPPHNGSSIMLELEQREAPPVLIPFTDVMLAIQWAVTLSNDKLALKE